MFVVKFKTLASDSLATIEVEIDGVKLVSQEYTGPWSKELLSVKSFYAIKSAIRNHLYKKWGDDWRRKGRLFEHLYWIAGVGVVRGVS